MPLYQIFADDVEVWANHRHPTQDEVDRTAVYATEQGWNGTQLEFRCDGQFRKFLQPSEWALA